MAEYLELNRANWDDRVPAHVESAHYAVQRFLDDPAFLSDVVRFDLPLLGDVSGLHGVHLQCHIGTDTVSLARLGASMTGLDFSGPAVAEATRLATAPGADASFVQADVYDAANVLKPGSFDLVYTGVGALTWLPDIRRWARVVADLLRPGGRLFIRDGHPMLLALDVDHDGRLMVTKPYFETAEARVSDYASTYVQTDVTIHHTVTHWWNHGLGETVTALLEAGLTLTGLTEHDTVPWRAFSGETMVSADDGEWRLAEMPRRLAASFTIQAAKNFLPGGCRDSPPFLAAPQVTARLSCLRAIKPCGIPWCGGACLYPFGDVSGPVTAGAAGPVDGGLDVDAEQAGQYRAAASWSP